MPDTHRQSDFLNFKSFENFEDAVNATLRFLQGKYGFGLWMVTRTIQNDWIVLKSESNTYNVSDGDVFRWSDTFCYHMVQKKGPNIAPASDKIDAYVDARIAKALPIKAYIGYPLVNDEPMFRILSQFLSYVLKEDLKAFELRNRISQLEDKAFHDQLTGLLNRRAWDSLIELQ